jgi:hypothetical protein
MPDEALRGKRGPKPNPNRGRTCGYRITDRTRFEMQVAAPFVGAVSLQDTIALAVSEFLERTQQVDGYPEALQAAEKNQQRRTGIRAVSPDGGN